VTSTQSTAEADAHKAWAQPLHERQVAMTGVLAEGGLELALAIKDRAIADLELTAEHAEAAARAYARVARAVRMSLLLQAQAIKAIAALNEPGPQAGAADDGERITRITRIIVDPRRPPEADRREHAEQLDQDDIHRDLATRPVSDLVAEIREDLDLDPDRPRQSQAGEGGQSSQAGPQPILRQKRPYPDG
jgi:hypothetical protein